MPGWLQALLAVGIVVIALSTGHMALQPSPTDEARTARAVADARSALAATDQAETAYGKIAGHYGDVVDLTNKLPEKDRTVTAELAQHLSIQLSADGLAYFTSASFGGVECGHWGELMGPVDRSTAGQTRHQVLPPDWRLAAPNKGIDCRRNTWPASWLHPLGVGYLDLD